MPSPKKKQVAKKITKVSESAKKTKRIKTFSLALTEEELTHVRDVMSIILPPDGSTRLSESLATSEKRQLVESKLWEKVVNLCLDAKIPVGDTAPDFFVGMIGPLVLGCFQLENNEDESEE